MLTRRLGALFATLPLALAAGTALAQNADFRLNNRLDQPINEVYISSSGQGSWGPDLMGANVLAPGGVLSLTVPPGQCLNDIRLVLADGSTMERRQINTCELTDVNVTP
ncbi:hypothetical protein [Muricoccus radiodurans]|uniref:hypothetical protein n=1 Tax=Muricoccus radiodurans TaxID=2231721 RepID=UPI003CF4D5E3